MSGKPQLLYFELSGRGEVIRLLYKHAGADFEDKRISFQDYGQNYKTNAEECPLAFLPVLTTSCGKKISQTTAIIRYVANELKLFGKNNVEQALIDLTIVSNKELSDKAIDIVFSQKSDEEKAKLKESLKTAIDKYFTYFEKLVKENGGPFLVGSEITVGDIYLTDCLNGLTEYKILDVQQLLEKYPLLKDIYEKVLQSDNIKRYLENQKK
ncbi:glutathione S-transferase-like [Clytia hemisphaerica]|uniref:Glutathione S-transferase n=1 Tax=Clytia hemisphaerica TaxID=252671 RepID=A0A7M5X2Z1_9CNID